MSQTCVLCAARPDSPRPHPTHPISGRETHVCLRRLGRPAHARPVLSPLPHELLDTQTHTHQGASNGHLKISMSCYYTDSTNGCACMCSPSCCVMDQRSTLNPPPWERSSRVVTAEIEQASMQVIIDDHVCEQHPLTTPCFSVMHLRTPGQSQPVAALLPLRGHDYPTGSPPNLPTCGARFSASAQLNSPISLAA